ncbi:MAG: hypothetical protein HQL69_24350 [Magnetococcales bacterium]|nr:hypothetical protein [Magnetococcales bacterium]
MDMSDDGCWDTSSSFVAGVNETFVGIQEDSSNGGHSPMELYISFCFDDFDSTDILSGDIRLTNIPPGATLNIGKAGPDQTWIFSQDHLQITEINESRNPVGWEIPGLTMTTYGGYADYYILGILVTVFDGEQFKEFANHIKVSRNND